MPLRKHRQNFRHHSCCFTASAAVDWLHQLLCNNSNFGPDVTRQQTVQLLKKFLKNHVIEDVKGRWGTEDLEDNGVLYRWAGRWGCKNSFKLSQEVLKSHLLKVVGANLFLSSDSPPPLRWRKSPVRLQPQPLIPLGKDRLSETKRAFLGLRVLQRARERQRWGKRLQTTWYIKQYFTFPCRAEGEILICLYLLGKYGAQHPIGDRQSAGQSAGAETTADRGGWTGDLEIHHLNPV